MTIQTATAPRRRRPRVVPEAPPVEALTPPIRRVRALLEEALLLLEQCEVASPASVRLDRLDGLRSAAHFRQLGADAGL